MPAALCAAFFRGLVFASKFLFDILTQCPEFAISFADRPALRAQCPVTFGHDVRFEARWRTISHFSYTEAGTFWGNQAHLRFRLFVNRAA